MTGMCLGDVKSRGLSGTMHLDKNRGSFSNQPY